MVIEKGIEELVFWILSGLLSILVASYGWFITNTLAKIDANQTKLHETVSSLAVSLARLQGEYEARKGMEQR